MHKQKQNGSLIIREDRTTTFDDIVKDLGTEVKVSLFADDLAVWVQHEEPKECERLMQLAIGKIEQWAKKWRMELNAAKTEYILFSNWNRKSKWEEHLVLNGQQIKRNDTPKFLGVRFDWNITFTNHFKQVKDKMRQRLRALRAVSHKRWGSRTEDLRTLSIGFVRSVAEYAGAAWMTAAFAGAANVDKNFASRERFKEVFVQTLYLAAPCTYWLWS